MSKTVRDAMSRDPKTAAPTDWVADAAQAMRERGRRFRSRRRRRRLLGILTDRDIVVRAVAARRDPQA